MAIKHVVTQGVGFTVPSYILTDGIGDFSAGGGGGGGGGVDRRLRRRRFVGAVLHGLLLLMLF
ncbi:MAG: hypothetical protein A4C66_03270 [Nitrospira sp. HN-bin3]|uniref:hypothetical protein n=1 Tax=Nitrospira cf. moscoviensis SBR1015 TaxID=96242 RepID=UPI000A0A53C0|nr:hypothetical protein [Nitrospira cf. moscoviensis SBR1015]OQW37066.1 MAG: hypothetical protein A4C66_03270 [Nitrospira sp. HN-bin3]